MMNSGRPLVLVSVQRYCAGEEHAEAAYHSKVSDRNVDFGRGHTNVSPPLRMWRCQPPVLKVLARSRQPLISKSEGAKQLEARPILIWATIADIRNSNSA